MVESVPAVVEAGVLHVAKKAEFLGLAAIDRRRLPLDEPAVQGLIEELRQESPDFARLERDCAIAASLAGACASERGGLPP